MNSNTYETDRLLWPEIMKIAALFAVILIHSAAPLLVRYQKVGSTAWWIGNLYDSAARWCIPVFVMLSGTFLIDKADGSLLGRFLRRRVRRVLIPFLVWSGLYFLWRIYINHEPLAFKNFFTLIFLEPVYYHLWFLYILIGLYLIAPIVNVYMQHASTRSVLYFLILWVLFGSLLPMVESFYHFSIYPTVRNAESLFAYFGYFVLGRALRDVVPTPMQRLLLIIAWFVAFGATTVGTWYLTIVRNGGTFDALFYDYYSINVIVMALSIFLAMKGKGIVTADHVKPKGYQITIAVAACVPGMYLIHAMIISMLLRGLAGFSFSKSSLPLALGVPVFAGVVFAISLMIIIVIRKVPGVKWIVP
ncbi:MAG: acyltransferase family protein [Chitinivibrionales bacterium]|nr:acyltransferase family protein [Chitinivibrionales bacterium]